MKTIYITSKNKDLESRFFITIKLLFATTLLLVTFSCSDDEACGYTNNAQCDFTQQNNDYSGFTVTTNFDEDANASVGAIFNTQLNSNAPLGDDWGTTTLSTQVTSISPTNWTRTDIGQVFGIAIDDSANIYLAASDIYYFGIGISSSNTRPGAIYKCVAPSFTAVQIANLPNTGDVGNGIGNIAYDKLNNQLFATNLEDGKIYRLTTSGLVLETYDPWGVDDLVSGIERQEEQIWGIGVNYESGQSKVYFPRVATATNPERSIYSLTLQSDGSFPSTSNAEVIEIPNVPGTQLRISDIAFSSTTNQMLIAERTGPHSSKVMSYNKGGSWNYNLQYFVGANAGADGENSAGGVDFYPTEQDGDISAFCDESFWATGNYMRNRTNNLSLIYGIQGIDYTGNNSFSVAAPNANQDTDIFIDFDGLDGTSTKGNIGDVEVFDANRCYDLCNN